MLREEIPEKWISCSNNKACAVTLATFRFRSPISNIQPQLKLSRSTDITSIGCYLKQELLFPSLDDPLPLVQAATSKRQA